MTEAERDLLLLIAHAVKVRLKCPEVLDAHVKTQVSEGIEMLMEIVEKQRPV